MTDDIVTRLRAFVSSDHFNPGDRDRIEAADEIERLRAMILEYVAAETAQYPSEGWTGSTTYEQVMERAGRAWDTLVEEARRD